MTTIYDGTPVETAYDQMVARLVGDGYTKTAPDAWAHPLGTVKLTVGYTGRQFRVKWYTMIGNKEQEGTGVDITTMAAFNQVIDYINLEAKQ